jgi:hypothetical protein
MDYHDPRYYELGDLRPSLVRAIVNILSLDNPFPEHQAIPHFLYQLTAHNVLSFLEFTAISRFYQPVTTISRISMQWLCLFCDRDRRRKARLFQPEYKTF